MSTSKPIKAKARTKTFVFADRDAKVHHDLVVGVIEPLRHYSGKISDSWAYLELRRQGTEFVLDLPLPALEKLLDELGAAVIRLRDEPKPCTRPNCYYCTKDPP